jgi:hypothetical protein
MLTVPLGTEVGYWVSRGRSPGHPGEAGGGLPDRGLTLGQSLSSVLERDEGAGASSTECSLGGGTFQTGRGQR